MFFFFFFSSRRRHTRYWRDWSSDVCSSDLHVLDDALVVLADHKAGEGREDAGRDHLQVGERPRSERDLGEISRPLGALVALLMGRATVYERAAVRHACRVLG